MKNLDLNKEQEILNAAETIFTEKGLEGARMQEIADKAKINKSLLHYYYRSKDKLFLAVFKTVLRKFIPKVLVKTDETVNIFDKIKIVCSIYINMVDSHPALPLFVLHELNKNPRNITDTIEEVFKENESHFVNDFKADIENAIKDEEIKDIDPSHLIVNIISVSIFPAMAKPMVKKILFADDNKKLKEYYKTRNKTAVDFIIDSIKL